MEGWVTSTVGEACRLINGGTPKTKMPEFWDGPHAWITPAEMGGLKSPYVGKTRRTLTDEGLARCSASLLPPYSVIVSSRAPIGHLVINEVPMATNQGCKGLVPRENLDHKFLYYYLLCNVDLLNSLGYGTTFAELSATRLKTVPIRLPPPAEQRRIVSILDAAFEGIDTAISCTQQNIINVRALFERYLIAVFDQMRALRPTAIDRPMDTEVLSDACNCDATLSLSSVSRLTKTGGRSATTRHIPGPRSLAVGMPKKKGTRKGWIWSPLTALARMESGHTPSRRRQEYWGGSIPWIGIKDAKVAHGRIITTTSQHTNEQGIQNSSARVLPTGTVCLSRTASVGYVVVMGAPMATSQDFVNWVCSEALEPNFLKYLFLAQGAEIFRFSSGSVHQTIYFPEAKAFHIFHPEIEEQRRIVRQADKIRDGSERLEGLYQRKLQYLSDLKQSLLHKALIGALTVAREASTSDAAGRAAIDTKSAEFTADVLAIAYQRHMTYQRERTFGHVKAQKTLQLVESIGHIDLGRVPIRDAAGPNDFQHMLKAEDWAKANQFFEFVKRGEGYEFQKRANFAWMIESARTLTKPYRERLDRVLDLLVWMDSRQAEIFTTVHAAWNNLLLDDLEITDEAIIREARDNWHEKKQKIPESEFRDAIRLIERKGLAPTGDGKRVGERRLF